MAGGKNQLALVKENWEGVPHAAKVQIYGKPEQTLRGHLHKIFLETPPPSSQHDIRPVTCVSDARGGLTITAKEPELSLQSLVA